MKKGLTQIVLVLDESTSMGSVKEATVDGINKFIREQKELPGEALFTLVKFSSTSFMWNTTEKNSSITDHIKFIYESENMKNVKELAYEDFVPKNATALLDAVGLTIDNVGLNLDKLNESEKPQKVLFVILTDGEENSSTEVSMETLKEKIELQKNKYSWEFLFLGADLDNWGDSHNMGLSKNSVAVNKNDMINNMSKTSVYTAAYRSAAQDITMDFFEMDQEKVEKELNNYKNKK